MGYEKSKYERLIMESPLFLLNKDEEYTAYKRESYRMIENLYCYLMAINEVAYEPYGCEITEVATRCINNYDASRGVFLHYFNSAWKQEYSHILGDQAQDDKLRGIKITEEDKRAVKKYMRFIQRHGEYSSTDELHERLSVAMDMPVNRIREIVMLGSTTVVGDSYANDAGDDLSLWERIADDFQIEKDLMDQAQIELLFEKIGKVFADIQERQRPLVADLLTIKICSSLVNIPEVDTFINWDIVNEWKKTGTIPTQRDIAQKYQRNEASISRSYKEFLKKLRKEG